MMNPISLFHLQAKPFNIIPTSNLKPMLPHANSFIVDPLRQLPTCICDCEHKTLTTIISEEEDNKKMRAIKDYKSLFTCQRLETSKPVQLSIVDGSIPEDFPRGTYYLIGPGLFTDDHGSTVHPLDGHGYLRAFEINGRDREVKFSAQYVKTRAQIEEFDARKKTWTFSHRGPFSVLKGGKVLGNTKVMKNVANTTVLKWGGRLFCLWEGGAPYELQPGSLDTLARFDLINGEDDDGVCVADVFDVVALLLKPILHGLFKMPRKRILSHYKIDVKRNRLMMMACNAEDMLLPRSHFTFYEFDTDFKLIHKQEFNISDHLMVHDWAFTDTHYLLFGNRVQLDIPGLLVASCGLSPMIAALSPNPNKSTSPLYLFPRHPRTETTIVEIPSQLWLLHVANALEEKDEHGNLHIQIHAIACSYKWFNFQNMFGYDWKSGKFDPSMMNKEDEEHLLPHLIQVSVELDANGKCKNCSNEPLSMWTRPSDFPVINPNCHGTRHRYVYVATSSGSHQALPNFPFDTIVKLDTLNRIVQTWSATKHSFIGEPMFVPKAMPVDEDDGYLVVVEYAVSQRKCYLVIVDAKRIGESNPLVMRSVIPKYLTFPLGFHGVWDPV